MKSKILLTSLLLTLFVITGLVAQNSCPAPTGINASGITANSAIIQWNAVPSAVVYNVRFRVYPGPNNAWTNLTTTVASITITGLLDSTMYEYQVQTGCAGLNGAIQLSAFSASQYFTTLHAQSNTCAVPVGLFVNSITATSAKLNWATTGASSYKVRFRQTGTIAWTIVNAANAYKNISGLNASTSYQWQVRSICILSTGAIVKSNWSNSNTFVTSGSNACPAPSGLTITVAGEIGRAHV